MQYKHTSALVNVYCDERFMAFVDGIFPIPIQYNAKEAYEAHVRMVGNEAMGRWMKMLRYAKRMSQENLSCALGCGDQSWMSCIEIGSIHLFYRHYLRISGMLGRQLDLKDTFPVTGQETEGQMLVKLWPYLSAHEQDNVHADLMVGRKLNTNVGKTDRVRTQANETWMKEAFTRIHALKVERDTRAERLRVVENKLAELEGRLPPHEDGLELSSKQIFLDGGSRF
ncbi:MAG: hypothetical protein WAZ18_07075 [Alphaproteobacteria bacterium]